MRSGTAASPVSVTSNGNITTTTSRGIQAQATAGAVTVTSTGDIRSATNASGTPTGTTANMGILAVNTGANAIGVTNSGKIAAFGTGIAARATGTAGITISNTGDITSATTTATTTNTPSAGITIINAAISAQTTSGSNAIGVTTQGNLTSGAIGIYARHGGSGTVTVNNTLGNITAGTIGVIASSASGSASVTSKGDILSGTQTIWVIAATNGTATVDSTGNLTTTTTSTTATAAAIYATSATGIVNVTTHGDITATGDTSVKGIYAINAGAGAVTVKNYGSTNGIRSSGIGIFGKTTTGSVQITSSGPIASTNNRGIAGQATTGSVTINNTGDIRSSTSSSILAGGGNNVGISAVDTGSGAISVTNSGTINSFAQGILARSTGTGAISVISTGDITEGNAAITSTLTGLTGANYSAAIFAQNIGGANNVSVSTGGALKSNRYGVFALATGSGTVSIANTGSVDTTTGTIGLFARNTDGGNVEITSSGPVKSFYSGIFARANTGTISVQSSGDVTSSADAITSYGGASSQVNVTSGKVFGYYSAVRFIGGTSNTLNNYGALYTTTLTTGLAANSRVIKGGTGNDTINNYGLIVGSVNLDGGTNAFNNRRTGSYTGFFYSGATVNLGTGNTLTNEGVISPGGFGTIQATTVTGNFVQTSTGAFTVDIDQSASVTQHSDLLTISGTADFDGHVYANPIAISPTGSVLILTAAGGLNLASGAEAYDTATTDFKLQAVGLSELWLTWLPMSVFDLFATRFLTPNQTATASYLDALRQAGPSSDLLDLIDAVKSQSSEAEIAAALDRLHGEHYLSQVNDTLQSSYLFNSGLMSCPTTGAEYSVITEGQCLWAKVGGRLFEQDTTPTNIGGETKAYSASAGAQVALHDNWRFGFAGSYEQIDLETNKQPRRRNSAHKAVPCSRTVGVRQRWPPLRLAAGDSSTPSAQLGLRASGRGRPAGHPVWRWSEMRFAVVEQGNGWYVKPMVDVNATYIEYGGFTETGGGVAALESRA